MALTYTPQPEIGASCPDFSLPGVDGNTYSLSSFADKKALLIMFICNHCPYVKGIEDRLIELGNSLKTESVGIAAICSNDPTNYEEDSFDNLKKRWKEKSYPFIYLHDLDQTVAKAYGAVCTPDFFVYDQERKLVYRGRLDDSWKEPAKVTQQDLKLAILGTLEGKPPMQNQIASMGCSIKWTEA